MAGLRHRDWHLIAEQRFRRRAMLDVVAQRFRGAPYIVIADYLSGQYMRLDGRARLMWDRLDGSRTMHELWRDLAGLPGTFAPSQKELMEWVLQLSSAGLILSDHQIDPDYLQHRSRSRRDKQLEGKAISPLAIRVPLFDPDPLVRALYPLVRPLFSLWGALGLGVLLLAALLAVIVDYSRVIGSTDGVLLSQSGMLAMLVAYPIMKALHEFGHAVVLYHYGGRVREAGVMLLLFFPLPYVDASSAAAIPSHKARMMVGAAGVIVEVTLAALALLLWLQAEGGVVQAILFSFVVMGTISTLAFNGNPLLKFDAYYVLADWLQMPNLAARSGAYLQDQFLSRLLGLRPQEVAAKDEAPILLLYGIGSLVYRLLLTLVIVAIVSQMFFVLGLILAFWSLVMAVIWPLIKMIKKGRAMVQSENARRRVSGRLALIIGLLGAVVFLLPLPFSVQGEGQIIAAPRAEIRAGASGLVSNALGQGLPAEGAIVATGQDLLTLENPSQATEYRVTQSALAQTLFSLSAPAMPVNTRRVVEARRIALEASLAQIAAREAALHITAPIGGKLAWPGGHPPLAGRYFERGELIARIANPDEMEAIFALPPFFAGILPADGAQAQLLLPNGEEVEAKLLRRLVLDRGDGVPQALLSSRGGTIAEDPQSPGTALAPAIALWAKPEGQIEDALGQRFDIRIDLEPRSLASQLLFHIDRIFLRITRF